MNLIRKLTALPALVIVAAVASLAPSAYAFITGSSVSSGAASVTQATSRATGVTINAQTGTITTNNTSLAAGASATFTVTNNTVGLGDVPIVAIRSGATNRETSVSVTTVAAGSFQVTVHNRHASTAETGAIIVNFAVVKRVLSQ